ncbi:MULTISPECIES: hypothetical protein [unclassified Flavobacterium]|uniref:hypothetical protein n=1 Tax=unclassified Flavobacterium TaxID=196869 RepID=UPI00131E62BA|nr:MULTISPECIES: hypothetical protein [unclassified Flavobacterium]
MNPKISLQNHFKFSYKKEIDKVYQLSAINKILEKWKDDYKLMVEIDKNNKCICNSEMHWIHKLQCPEKVYSEGYEFKRLYESLVFATEVGKINKDCLNLYNEYLSFQHSPTQLIEWEQRMEYFVNINKSIFDTIWFKLVFKYQDGNKLSSAEPFLSDDFDFEIQISPDNFQGVSSLFGLLYSDYPQHIKI